MSAEPVYPYEEAHLPAHPEPVNPRARPVPFEATEVGMVRPEAHSPKLDRAAQSVGATVGKAVEAVQHLPERLQDLRSRFTVIRGRAKGEASVKAEELKETAAKKVSEARTRAGRLAHQYPLQLILGMAGVGLVLGIALRIWRDHAD